VAEAPLEEALALRRRQRGRVLGRSPQPGAKRQVDGEDVGRLEQEKAGEDARREPQPWRASDWPEEDGKQQEGRFKDRCEAEQEYADSDEDVFGWRVANHGDRLRGWLLQDSEPERPGAKAGMEPSAVRVEAKDGSVGSDGAVAVLAAGTMCKMQDDENPEKGRDLGVFRVAVSGMEIG